MAAPSKITVDQFVDPVKAAKDTAANINNLREEVERQSGLVYYYNTKYANATRQAARIKLQLERKEAQTAIDIRADAAAQTPPEKLTADMVKERVRMSLEVTALEVAKIDADEVEDTLRGICAALRDKSSNLITLSTMHRDEIKAKIAFEEEYQGKAESSGSPERSRGLKERWASQ